MAQQKAKRVATARKPPKKGGSFDSAKEFNGTRYTGMKVGRTHHWYYDRGDWKEKKVTPDNWEFTYSTVKRRAGHAPEGSGAPVGTGYHWFILAHQFVGKLNANDYMAQMVGLKYKLAHKRADKGKWNASENARKKILVALLKSLIDEIEASPEQLTPVPLDFEYQGQHYSGNAMPVPATCKNGICRALDLTLGGKHIGVIRQVDGKWKISELKSTGLARAIGEQIAHWYQRK